MQKTDVIKAYLPDTTPAPLDSAEAVAPSNIALCKYWGKRDKALNLPVNDSLSISLGALGSRTRLQPIDGGQDEIFLNGQPVAAAEPFAARTIRYLDLFRSTDSPRLRVETFNSIPTAAGLASSASGFAALIQAIDRLYGYGFDQATLSAFARMGSGSASRSLFHGFVHWRMGVREDGMDSIASPLPARWPEFRLGLLTLSAEKKAVGSREGMQRTLESAHLYQSWPLQAAADLEKLLGAIDGQDFSLLGQTAEQNALSMHATMIASWPPLLYWQPESVATMQRIWQLRAQGLELYFTMDAGPNIKLLFSAAQETAVLEAFPEVQVVAPFDAVPA